MPVAAVASCSLVSPYLSHGLGSLVRRGPDLADPAPFLVFVLGHLVPSHTGKLVLAGCQQEEELGVTPLVGVLSLSAASHMLLISSSEYPDPCPLCEGNLG